MNKITFPLKAGMQGSRVSDLQDALRVCLDHEVIFADDERARLKLSTILREERATSIYGEVTVKLVGAFQSVQGLRTDEEGVVGEVTADALNKLLSRWGLLEENHDTNDLTMDDTRYTVSCRVVDSQGQPIADLRVEAFNQNSNLPDDQFGAVITNKDGLVTIRFRRSDFAQHSDGRGPDLYFAIYRGEIRLDYILPDIANDKGILRNFQQQREPFTVRINDTETIQGVVFSENKLPIEKLKLRLYRLDFSGNASMLKETTTQAGGQYTFSYDEASPTSSLEIRAVKTDGTELPLSKPLNELTTKGPARLELNLLAPASLQPPLDVEYNRLLAD